MKTLIATSALGFTVSAFAASLGPGSPAPAMDVKTWVKGTPVNAFEPDKTYVVEFWATWCGPCKESIPHLTELAKKNPDVKFVGVSIWEDDKDKQVEKFVDGMGAKMDYSVGYSGNQDGMAKTWMQAASQNGIPTAFIVKNGEIEWVGHPMTLEKPLAEIKSGSCDIKAFKTEFDKSVKDNEARMAIQAALQNCVDLYKSGKTEDAKKALDEVVLNYPETAGPAKGIKFDWLAKEDPAAWEAKATELSKSAAPPDIQQLCHFALVQAQDPGGKVELGRKALALALKGTGGKNFQVLLYAFNFHESTKEYKLAIKDIDDALVALPGSEYKNNSELKGSLEDAKKQLQAKLTK